MKPKKQGVRCAAVVPAQYGEDGHCSYPGRYWEDGRCWCGVHRPSKVESRRDRTRS